jgi:glutathione synthase/RimK-type ligase-like ATP-grasp enzyme
MIVCLYGKTCADFVEPVALDLEHVAKILGTAIVPLTVEDAIAAPWRWREVERVYVLPFDVPRQLPPLLEAGATALVSNLFPRAELVNPFAVQELCWDKLATAQRLLARGVPMPDSLITDLADDARQFIHEHEHAILKATHSCGGEGHVVVFPDDEGNIVGETHGRRYVIEFQSSGSTPTLSSGILSWPPPFYLQRLVADVNRRGVLVPAQILRAYVVNGQILFWTERYRERCHRPSDFIINIGLGAKYRFLPNVSEEARKAALRAAEVLGVRIGAVDLIRTGSEGPYVLEVDTDGYHMIIDRQFKRMPAFRPQFDFDRFIAEAIIAPPAAIGTRVHA